MGEAEKPQAAAAGETVQAEPQPPAEVSTKEATAQAAPAPEPAQAAVPPAQTPSPDPPAPAAPSATNGPSARQKVGAVLEKIASMLVSIAPALPPGPIVLAADAADGALRMVAGWLSTQGSLNDATEAQAEAALKRLTDSLADLSSPLPTPAELESGTLAQ